MEDTVTLARQEREKQGLRETEVSYGEEADLHRHLTGCDKNPYHQNFIPVDQFNVEHLPSGCHDNGLIDVVRAMSDLTVRVSVKYVSDSRPETVPGRDKPFPCYKDRGRDMMRTGTGFVDEVKIYQGTNHKRYTICEWNKCMNSPALKTEYAYILIVTAAHLVYDNLEAAHTTCDFFFDYGGTPADCNGVVTLTGLSVEWCDLKTYICYMKYRTHDLDLACRLKIMCRHHDSLITPITPSSFYEHSRIPRNAIRYNTAGKTMIIIVSHPHGCSKQVSFGSFIHLEKTDDGMAKYMYTTPTCPGSSGAHVCMIDKRGLLYGYHPYVHSGDQCEGPWEVEVSYGGEADLHRHLRGCDKNPDHQNFIPVDQFDVDHLPPGCQDNNLVDFVRIISDLTVRVSVKYVSENRPKTFPGIDRSFPCYNARGKDMLRTGTGLVYLVYKCQEHYSRYKTWRCKECVNSPTPKSEFAHIHIRTAAHIVYDEQEGTHTTCDLFFDKGSKPEYGSGVVALTDVTDVKIELDRDKCIMTYVTHDLDLADRLVKMVLRFNWVINPLRTAYLFPETQRDQPFQIPIDPSPYFGPTEHLISDPLVSDPKPAPQTRHTLTIIVSHPHGCSKQVSVGHYTDIEGRHDALDKFTYSIPTCHGSSGAYVFTASIIKRNLFTEIDHSGGICEGDQQRNFSVYG